MTSTESTSCLSIYDRVRALPGPGVHVDSDTFVRDVHWYQLFESSVLDELTKTAIFHWISPNDQASITLPMIRIKTGMLRPVGLASMQNYYSVDFRPLCTSASVRAEMTQFFDALISAEMPDVIELQALDTNSPEYPPVLHALTRPGWRVVVRTCQINWIHDLESSDFEQYMSERPKRVLNTLNRKRKALYKAGKIQIDLYTNQQGLEKGLQDYQQVYERSWKVAESHERFVLDLIQYYASRNELRLGILAIDGVPVAVHFWVVRGTSAFIYKLAHDKQFDKLSPGTVLMAYMLEQVIDRDNVNRLDFLTGDDAYKRDWMSQRRKKVLLKAYNIRTIKGFLNYVLDQHIRTLVSGCASMTKRLFSKNKVISSS